MLVTLAVTLGLMTWYGRHSLVPGPPAVRVTYPSAETEAAAPAQGHSAVAAGISQGTSNPGGSSRNTTVSSAAGTYREPPPAEAQLQLKTVSPPAREQVVSAAGQTYPVKPYKPLAAPDDPLATGWWISQAKLEQSWEIPAGGTQTLLAIIDGGFALDHEEFAGRWHQNPSESGLTATEAPSDLNCTDRALPLTAACNLIDDNGDGFIDNENGSVDYQNP